MLWNDIPETDKKRIIEGESYSNLKIVEGYKNLLKYLNSCKTIAEQSIIKMDTKTLTDLEVRSRILESQARVKIYNEMYVYMETAIQISNELKIALLDQDNGGR